MMNEEQTKRLGALLVACAAALFAEHNGMPSWKLAVVFVSVSLGLRLLAVGRV